MYAHAVRVSCVFAVLLFGCSGASSEGAASAPIHVVASNRENVPPPTADRVPPPPAAELGYELHESGLVRAGEGDTLRVGAVAPVDTIPHVAFKPVLYFHTQAPQTLRSVVVRAAEGGSLAEVWTLAPFDQMVRWENVAIETRERCEPSELPTATAAPCAGLPVGDFCESAALAVARTSDAACVTVGAAVELFLFYRARVTRFTPPLVFERTGRRGDVRVTNAGALPIPGLLVRLRSEGGVVQALSVPPPTPGASVLVGAHFDAGATVASPPEYWNHADAAAPGRSALHHSILEIGLTPPEAAAFIMAWEQGLFQAPRVGTGRRSDAPLDSFVYFLPEPSTDGIARLELDPPPRATHRAIAVWSVLRANGPSH